MLIHLYNNDKSYDAHHFKCYLVIEDSSQKKRSIMAHYLEAIQVLNSVLVVKFLIATNIKA